MPIDGDLLIALFIIAVGFIWNLLAKVLRHLQQSHSFPLDPVAPASPPPQDREKWEMEPNKPSRSPQIPATGFDAHVSTVGIPPKDSKNSRQYPVNIGDASTSFVARTRLGKNTLRSAVVWSEILAPPVALRNEARE